MLLQKRIIFEKEALKRARYLGRPNRFLVRFRRGRFGGLAYVMNPGRMGEILLGGTDLLLASRRHTRTGWEAVGATWSRRWQGDKSRLVCLNSARINMVAERLIRENHIPELAGCAIVQKEFTLGRSRIDFLLSRNGRPYLLEVKSVTLVEHGVAFFPDAVTERGRRHLEELSQTRQDAGILFLVQGDARFFLPDFHNDLAFARIFQSVLGRLDVFAYSMEPELTADHRICIKRRFQRLIIPGHLLPLALSDRGVYILAVRVPRRMTIRVGSLGSPTFQPGWYLYAGSAMRGLSKRIGRHLRVHKRLHYHIDYLRAKSVAVRAFPVRGFFPEECVLAEEIERICHGRVEGFGCSDCDCRSHLFYFPQFPCDTAPFQELLTRLRHKQILHSVTDGSNNVSPVTQGC